MHTDLTELIADAVAFCSWVAVIAWIFGGIAYGTTVALENGHIDPFVGLIMGLFGGGLGAALTCGPMLLFVDLWRMFHKQRP